jgi:putative ABC transport system substrate-binding protein
MSQRRLHNRRNLLAALAAGMLGVPLASRAQQQKVYRVGVLASDSLETRGPSVAVFMQAMRDLGYVQGRNVVYEARYADADTARLSALATELAGLGLDAIVAPNGLSAEAAAHAAEQGKRRVPIVFAGWATPVGSGRVASFARPGGDVTGVTNITVELEGKQLQILKQAFPKISRVAVFVDSVVSAATRKLRAAGRERLAKELGVQMLLLEAKGADDVERIVASLLQWRADAIFVENAPSTFNNRKLLVHIAERARLPAIYGTEAYAEVGGLMSYGSDDKARWRQVALFVDKIFKGARPGDLPIEIPSKFDLVINLRTAKALGVTIPQTVLLQADRVID